MVTFIYFGIIFLAARRHKTHSFIKLQLLIIIVPTFWISTKALFWIVQVVQDIPPPIPLDVPMVLIKPREACPTAEVYKVRPSILFYFGLYYISEQMSELYCLRMMCHAKKVLILQHLRLDQTSKVDPLTLLEQISRNGLSQDVCINDLGMSLWGILCVSFSLLVLPILSSFPLF